MRIAVLKFGGTSVATQEARVRVCQHVEQAVQEGNTVVVVISAMGRAGDPYATDTLLNLILKEAPQVVLRELDLAFSCGELLAGALITGHLQQRGHKASCLTGQQAGLVTDGSYGRAKLREVNTDVVRRLLQEGRVVVVCGGQGSTADGHVTSLGRGSSDITCCALGVALDAMRMEVFSDVRGVMTADPKIIPEATVIERMSYTQCLILAKLGAKVMHPLSVEIAQSKPHIPLRVRSTFEDHPGTVIDSQGSSLLSLVVVPCEARQRTWTKLGIVGRMVNSLNPVAIVSQLQREGIDVLAPEESENVLSLWVTAHAANQAARIIHNEILLSLA